MRKSSIKITLDQYSGLIDALKEYKELYYITYDQKYIEHLLLKNMNKSNIFFMNISNLIFKAWIYLLTKSLNRLIVGVYESLQHKFYSIRHGSV